MLAAEEEQRARELEELREYADAPASLRYGRLPTTSSIRTLLSGEQADEHGAAWADDAATHVY